MLAEEKRISACLSPELDARFKHLWHLVGNTPMLELNYTYHGKPGKVHVKCENYNLTGSIKDRMALYVMNQAYRNCKIRPGDTKTDLAKEEQTVTAQGKDIKTIGNKWSNLQAEKFQANSQPFYVLLDDNGSLLVPPSGADYDLASYLKFLDSGLNAFRATSR